MPNPRDAAAGGVMSALGKWVGDRRGVSLVELIVASAILSIMVLASIGSFNLITRGIHQSRTKTIANNLIQEKMEVLKNYSYYQLTVTSATTVDNNYGVVYDNNMYPSEQISLWGYPVFTRATHVAYAEMSSGVVSTVPYSSVDTGLKQIIAYLMWKDGDTYKKLTIKNLMANPSASGMDSGFRGTVTDSAGSVVPGAKVVVVGFPNWTGSADAAGAYSFAVARGTYSVTCSSTGYYSAIQTSQKATRGFYTTTDFTNASLHPLIKIASGAITTTVWISTSLLISQVAAGTGTYTDGGTKEKEYVELYNPTTFTWTISAANFELLYDEEEGGAAAAAIPLTFNVTSLPASHYFLIASTGVIEVNNRVRYADAVYTTLGSDVIQDWTGGASNAGGVGIRLAGGPWLDRVAWRASGAGKSPPVALVERNSPGDAPDYTHGLEDGWIMTRLTSTGTIDSSFGNAYDTDNNASNFEPISDGQDHLGAPLYVNNSTDQKNRISGKPAHGAFSSADDTLSVPSQSYAKNPNTSLEYAEVLLNNITTGTWTVKLTSGAYMLEIGSVQIVQGSTITIPGSNTANSHATLSGYAVTVMTSAVTGGFLQGYLYGAGAEYYTPLPNILMEANGTQVRTAANGFFFANITTGAFTGYANFNNDNPAYTSGSMSDTIVLGQIYNIPEIHLAQQGTIMGYVTSGTGALPNVTMKAKRGASTYEGFSDGTGYFYVYVPNAASNYTVTPVLPVGQSYSSSPDPAEGNPASGQVIHVGTFTITGGMGTISGAVKDGTTPITTGVLVIASRGAIPDPPDAVYGSSAPALSNPLYSVSSQADGTYSLEVTAGSYNMSAYYPTVDTQTGGVTYKRKTRTTPAVTPTSPATGQDFTGAWP
ncbi:MAG: carboxypeptidase regulatory-like domain-containing protein [Elusimicrobia bacterium]|nr:carboxypeptidase regulatory-like domain-containing protein [Elusimicrobiota bacterium]